MQNKQVILLKTEYDAMEQELNDLRAIVASRQVMIIVEENLNWRITRQVTSGTRIKYIIQDEQVAMKTLAEQVKYYEGKLQDVQSQLYTCNRKSDRKTDEINRLNKQKWYHKLFRIKINTQ